MINSDQNSLLLHKQKSAIKIMLLAVFIDLLGLTILLPILPFWVIDIGQPDYVFVEVITLYSLFQFIFSPLWGRLSDKIGRRPVIFIGLFGNILGYLLLEITALFFFNSVFLLIVSRVIGGIFSSATLPTSKAYISDVISDKKERTKYFGFIGAVFGLAFTIGPAMSGLTSNIIDNLIPVNNGYWAPIIIMVILSCLNLAFGLKNLPESHSPNREQEKSVSIIQKSSSIKVLKNNPTILIVISVFFTLLLGFSSLDAVLALYGKQRFGMNEVETGFVFMTAGITLIIFQGLLVGRLAKRIDNSILMLSGTIILMLSFYLITVVNSVFTNILAAIPVAIGMSFSQPSGLGILTTLIPEENRGEILGINDSLSSLARLIGPILAIFVFSMNIFYPWYVDSILLGISSILAFIVYINVTRNGLFRRYTKNVAQTN